MERVCVREAQGEAVTGWKRGGTKEAIVSMAVWRSCWLNSRRRFANNEMETPPKQPPRRAPRRIYSAACACVRPFLTWVNVRLFYRFWPRCASDLSCAPRRGTCAVHTCAAKPLHGVSYRISGHFNEIHNLREAKLHNLSVYGAAGFIPVVDFSRVHGLLISKTLSFHQHAANSLLLARHHPSRKAHKCSPSCPRSPLSPAVLSNRPYVSHSHAQLLSVAPYWPPP